MPSLPEERPRMAEPRDLGMGLLYDAIRDAVVVTDEQGGIVLWNPGAEALFGWTREDVEGRNVLMLVPEPYRERHRQGMARFAATGHGSYVDTRAPLELPALRKDGTQIMVELTLTSLESPRRRYALAILRDVTERVRLREDLERRGAELERSNRELSRVNESLTAFTYVVSHDLKEPVRAIDTYLRILEEEHGHRFDEDAADVLRRAHAATGRLGSLLRGLLDLSQVDREELALQPTDLRAVLEGDTCRTVYDSLLRERGGRLDVDADAPPLLATPGVLCQALANLVSNALRHNPRPAPRVRVSGRLRPDGHVEVAVEDDGPGYPPALVERFNAVAGGGPRDTLRAGFGLLIARRAVERLGGRMWLGASLDMGGAAARFTLPAAR